jgi:ABC-type transport system involved in multi-copper enzyme maturation permease subunit
MTKYIRGELYRLLHKKSIYIYFAALAVGYVGTMFLRVASLNEYTIADDMATLSAFLPAILGGFLFSAIYTDDLNSKNLITLVGFGLGKIRIIVSKFILMTAISALIYAIIPLWSYGVLAAFGHMSVYAAFEMSYAIILKMALLTLAYSLVASIVCYGTQRTTFSLVTYLLFSLGIVDAVLGMIFKIRAIHELMPNISDYLIDHVVGRIFLGLTESAALAPSAFTYLAYLAVFIVVSMFAFKRKEMEF